MRAQEAMFSIARWQVKKIRCPRLPATKKPPTVKPGTVYFSVIHPPSGREFGSTSAGFNGVDAEAFVSERQRHRA